MYMIMVDFFFIIRGEGCATVVTPGGYEATLLHNLQPRKIPLT